MSRTPTFAKQAISLTDLQKNPVSYFGGEPVAVLIDSRTAGYIVPANVYQHMIKMIKQAYPKGRSRFRPSCARLDAVVTQTKALLADASLTDLGRFSE